MITSSPSPTISPGIAHAKKRTSSFLSRSHYDGRPHRSPQTNYASGLSRPATSNHPVSALPTFQKSPSLEFAQSSTSELRPSAVISTGFRAQQARPGTVDASTQYSPPDAPRATASSAAVSTTTPTSKVAGLHINETKRSSAVSDVPTTRRSREGIMSSPTGQVEDKHIDSSSSSTSSSKRSAPKQAERAQVEEGVGVEEPPQASPKRARKIEEVKIMPMQYERCNPRDLVILISSMLMDLIRYNDTIPLRDGQLTRFHSRAPPGISVQDYLQRLTTHATLSPPILLSMVYYIDRLCALYPSFTISSLTVHRFLITSATVASKGLSDSFWTNKTYARVGGVSLKELALLELEFLARVDWRIVPRAEVLNDYYRSLVEREPLFQMETRADMSSNARSTSQDNDDG